MNNALSAGFKKDDIGVWVPHDGVNSFGYSDGAWVEQYLEKAFSETEDLSSTSEDLEGFIKDWNTEYHLSRRRKDLLAGFDHNSTARVLEIGCGCGAITRYLGETYDKVYAVEGSYARARLARLRTADLPNVEVICSPYQDIGLANSFDIVFCIGVLEYAPTYVDGDAPIDEALSSMMNMLSDEGALVVAIENKNGLKYFANSTEDHSGTFFEGIEGYPRMSRKFETFGLCELKQKLSQHMASVDVHYPFPDYKMPECILSDEAFEQLQVGELIGSMTERDYTAPNQPFFDTKLAWPQIVTNGVGRDFSNSFLAIAGSNSPFAPKNGGRLGTLFNSARRGEFASKSEILRVDNKVIVEKIIAGGSVVERDGLTVSGSTTDWLDEPTLAYRLYRNAHASDLSVAEQLEPLNCWFTYMKELEEAGTVPGESIDLLWHNCCENEHGGIDVFDQELALKDRIGLGHLIIRAAFVWGTRYRKGELDVLGRRSLRAFAVKVARNFGHSLSASDFATFVKVESVLQSKLGSVSEKRAAFQIWFRLNAPFFPSIEMAVQKALFQKRRASNFLRRLAGRFSRAG